MPNRRKILQILAGLPVAGSLLRGNRVHAAEVAPASRAAAGRDIFKELGVQTFINGSGTLTMLSGSLMLPEVVSAMNAAAKHFANIGQVQDKVGERIAQLLKCEAAMVTSGAAAAMTLGTAATITGKDPAKIRLLPNLAGPQREVIIQASHRFVYDHAIRNTGAKLVEVEGKQQMEDAINENTVMMLFYNAASRHSVSREEFVEIGQRRKIPTFNDAAADVPPVENLFNYTAMGFDLVTFSGGKAIRGPQSAGLLFGRKDLIEAARLNHSPNGDAIGRSMKVNKEEMIGMMVALELYLAKDHKREWEEWIQRTRIIAAAAETVPTVKGETVINPGPANHFPGLRLIWDQARVKITPRAVTEALRTGEPSILLSGGNTLSVNVSMLEPGEAEIIARRIKEVLQGAV